MGEGGLQAPPSSHAPNRALIGVPCTFSRRFFRQGKYGVGVKDAAQEIGFLRRAKGYFLHNYSSFSVGGVRQGVGSHRGFLSTPSITAVPFWGQTTRILSHLSPRRDYVPKRINSVLSARTPRATHCTDRAKTSMTAKGRPSPAVPLIVCKKTNSGNRPKSHERTEDAVRYAVQCM